MDRHRAGKARSGCTAQDAGKRPDPSLPLSAPGLLAAGLIAAVLTAFCSPLLAPPAFAGAWTFDAGTGQAILQASAVSSTHAFGPSSTLYASRPFDKVEVTLVIEYGLTDWLTLIAAPQFLHVSLGSPGASSYAGPGYSDLGARVRLWQGEDWVVSAQAVARLPGTGGSASAAAVGYEDAELDLRLLAGRSFSLWGRAAWLDVQLADRLRFGDPPDEWRLDASLGVRVAPRWQVLLQSFNTISQGAGEGPNFSVSYEYYKLQLSAAYDLTSALTLQVGMLGTVFARNAPQETGIVASALYRF